MNQTGWTVIETQFEPSQLNHKETLFSLSNGYLGTRGTFEEGYPGACTATFINGVYDDVAVMHTELVNCPDWLPVAITVGGDRFSLDQGEVLRYQRQLDLRWGILSRDVLWRSSSGHTINVHFERMVSMADEHVLVQRCTVTPVDFEGAIEVEASLNGDVNNHGVKHLEWLNQGGMDNRVWLHKRCCHSGIELGMAARVTCTDKNAQIRAAGSQGCPTLKTTVIAQPGQTVTLEKVVTVFTSREVSAPAIAAQERLASLPSYTIMLAAHGAVWDDLWQDCDVVIEGDPTAQIAVRYNLFQLLAAAPRHDDRLSIPAKTLSGFAYRGHVFWDTEIFILPFLTFTQPKIARNLLSYRYHTLSGARRKAKEAGYEGALYAWESASTGDEVTPRWVFAEDGTPVRIWCGDIELHINIDIAYAIWHYWQATGDNDWMQQKGAEIILDTAVFWGSRAEWNAVLGCYEIRDVIGPDENHERVDNNAFTNRMVQWHLETALAILKWLSESQPQRAAELEAQLDLTPERLQHWDHIARHMLVLHDPQTGLIEQFEGFFNLEDVNWADYKGRTQSMQAILGIEETNKRQILKQPDVLMLLYLLRQCPLKTRFANRDNQEILQTNWDYYSPRTDHTKGSSLGPAIHAILACDLGKSQEAYEHFMRAALVDLEDVRGNANEGIHGASTGGMWQAVIFGFAGVRLTEMGPIVGTSHLPPGWTRLKFKLQWRGNWREFDVRSISAAPRTLSQVSSSAPPTQIRGVIFDLDGVLTDTSPADLLPETLTLLDELRTAGIKVAIGSSSRNARLICQRLGIAKRLDAIADGYSVERYKPFPDVFLCAATQLGLEPMQCLVVENAASGIEAALTAGMWVVGLGAVEQVGSAHVVFESLKGVHATTMLAQLQQKQLFTCTLPVASH